MKLVFNEATTLKNSTLKNDLELCEKYGYDGIEIRLDKLKEFLASYTVDDLKQFFAFHRLKPYAFNALEFITFRDEEGFGQILRDLQFLCEIGQQIGCKTVIAVPTFDVGDYTKSEIKAETVRVLRELAEFSEPYGVKIAFEFCGYPNCSVNTFTQAYEIVKAVESSQVGLVLDCFHFHAMNSQLEDLQAADPTDIFVFHIDDCEDFPVGALRDRHRVWPGDGAIDLDGILRTLQSIGYNDMASIELFRPEYWQWEAEAAIQTGKIKMENVLRRYFEIERV
ncbi:sugar phosphate isomerase/epimerase [Geobacillus stearothermophilus]|uniref:sugar phosphate isomerase/epimerase family protein n=1 Tax=Geobacillus stearothermophilus TaxID=1422 RepID=UPI001F2A6AD5|nr:sugar phosphate isomerase/epimerase [Geobacillus stearothermophilus]MCK7606466.1 sugar phosphate isomerase/epimerase [Geobacillus stearothermophilus]